MKIAIETFCIAAVCGFASDLLIFGFKLKLPEVSLQLQIFEVVKTLSMSHFNFDLVQ